MTDLRDRARDDAEIRQRLADLAATIETDTTWDQLQILVATTRPPRKRRKMPAASLLGLAAAAAVIVLAVAAIVVSRHDDDRVDTAVTTTTVSTTTTTTQPGETVTPAPATSIPGGPSPIAGQGQAPVLDLPLVRDTLGFGSGSGADVADGGRPAPLSPTPTVPATTPTNGVTILPQGTSPDG
jgi:hypothetical protein